MDPADIDPTRRHFYRSVTIDHTKLLPWTTSSPRCDEDTSKRKTR